jgi:glycine cleavage system H protein
MIPEDLMYTKTHEWIRLLGQEAVIGITHFAQESLGDLTFIELPAVGDVLTRGQEMGTVESVKAASEIYSPVAGEVVAVNEDLESNPGLVNEDPYGQGWMVKVALAEQPEDLLNAAQYAANVEAQGH